MNRTHRRRGHKRPVQWVCSTGGYAGSSTGIVLGVTLGIELVGASGSAGSFDPPPTQRFTIERVVGTCRLIQTSGGGDAVMTFSFGVILLSSSSTGTVVLPNIGNSADGGAPWLYMAHFNFPESAVAQPAIYIDQATPNGPWFNAKSRRAVRQDQKLMLIAQLSSLVGASTGGYAVVPNIRTLISRVA